MSLALAKKRGSLPPEGAQSLPSGRPFGSDE